MRVLVTGGAGFIGSTIARLLRDRGDSVVVLDNLSSGTVENVPSGCELVRADIGERASTELVSDLRPDVVVHAAAQVSVVRSQADPALDRQVNLVGTAHVIEGARRAGSRRLVFLSSGGAVYGETSGASEMDLPVPASYYAIHKLAAEHYLAVSGVPYAIARLANVYGPGQRADLEGGVVAIFSAALAEGSPVTIYGSGEQRRDFVHVWDVAAAVLAMLDSPLVGGTWNVGSGESTSVNELLSAMESLAGRTVERRRSPARAGELNDSRLIATRAQTDLGWTPRITLREGLRTVLQPAV